MTAGGTTTCYQFKALDFPEILFVTGDKIALCARTEVALGNPIIVMGDKTSHGGTVITCSPFSDTHGKGWARVGDMTSCPRCKGVFPIAQGDASLTDDGKAVAY